jgi:hypothetical protein
LRTTFSIILSWNHIAPWLHHADRLIATAN